MARITTTPILTKQDHVVQALLDAGYYRARARELSWAWRDAGYSFDAACKWIKVGICDPHDAMINEDEGRTPEDYQD